MDGEQPAAIVNHAGDQILIIDIALLPKFRRTGIGSCTGPTPPGRPMPAICLVRCHVLHDSTARRFWEHAGFAAQDSDGVYVAMERPPQAPATLTAEVLHDLPLPARISRDEADER